MTIHRFALVVALATASTAGICTKTYNYAAPSPVPTPTPVADVIEFRVFGNPGPVPVLIKFTDSIDGASVLTTVSLPYIATIKSLDASIFLDVEASAVPLVVTGSSLQAQIYVNGRLFREAVATNITPLVVSASGTFRR
jgi:hypothetical protein